MSGWLLIVALLALGGILATLGDRLGSRVGKARLSLFNLRPRQTAVLITVLTGILISAISLGLMLLVSERLRRGLFELDQLEQKLALSRKQVEEKNAQLALAEQARQQAIAGGQQAQRQRQQAQQQRQQAEDRAQRLRQELKPLQDQRSRLEQERQRLSRDVRARDQDIRRTESELAGVRSKISAGEAELKSLETNLIALRRGDVAISSGQPLASAKVSLQRPEQAREVIDALLQQANLMAFQRVLPGQPANRQIVLVSKGDIAKLETLLARKGSWVVSILSAANVLRGEKQVLAFPDLRPNRPVLRRGEVMATTSLEADERKPEQVRSRLNLLLAATYAWAQKQGSLADGLQFDAAAVNLLSRELSDQPAGQSIRLEAVAVQAAETPDPIIVELRVVGPAQSKPTRP
ncbi:MAG: DUF3084 domain-containing protein [Prochlorococcaceae cyanobacterium]